MTDDKAPPNVTPKSANREKSPRWHCEALNTHPDLPDRAATDPISGPIQGFFGSV
jgi:hypothetical protein